MRVARFSSRSAHRPRHDAVGSAKRLNLFRDLAGLCPRARDSQRDGLAHRSHGNGAARARGFKFRLARSPFYTIAAVNFGAPAAAALSFPKWNSMPSIHIRCRMVASSRVAATPALAAPRSLAIAMPEARGADHLLPRTRRECAASKRAARVGSSPHRLTRP